MYKNYIDDFFEKGLTIEDINDYVEYWHNHETEQTLKDFLGLNDHEYEIWMWEGNDVIRDILYCRSHNLDLRNYSRGNYNEVDAR